MLFLLNYQLEIGSDVKGNSEPRKIGTPKLIQDEVQIGDLEDQPVYQGPQT